MEFPEEQCAEDTQQTEIQLDYSKSENAPESLENVYAKGLNSIGSVGEGNSSLITNQTSSEIKENLDESQSSSKSSKLNIRESDSGLGPSDPEGKEPESVENADGMEVEIQSSSTNNDQSSNHDEKMTECSETPSSSMEDTNACKEVITTNSALKVVGIGDGKGTVYNSAPEVAEAQEGDTGGNRSASGEATVLCNSNALSALWDYGILISSDESSDDDNDEPSTDAVMQDASTPRQSVVSLDSDTSSMSSSTSLFFTDDSESEDEQASGEKNRPNPRPKKPLMTDGELGLEDLPPIQDLHITVPEHDCTKIGEVLHIVDKLVIVQGIKNMPPLDLESVLFLAWDRPLGLVFDVFGPVVEPSYCVRFNSNDEIISRNITPGMPVYFGQKSQYTNYVFMKHLLNAKGSDASWTDNNEPPLEQLEFSDDEAERAAKKAIKAINKEIKVDPDEPQRKKHMAYEQRMNAMNLYMTRVSEMKQQRKRRPPPRKEVGCGRLIHAPVLTTLPPTVFQQPPPTPFHGGVPPPSFAAPPLAFNRFVPPPPPTALPKPPSMFVDTSRPPPHSPQPMLAFPPPNMAVPPPTTPPLFCNVNVPPPPNQIFRANNSVNLNSLFPDLFRTAPPIPSPAFSFPPPPMALTTPPPPPVAIVKAAADSSAPNTNRLPLPVFNHNPLHRPPATPTPPPYSLYINKA